MIIFKINQEKIFQYQLTVSDVMPETEIIDIIGIDSFWTKTQIQDGFYVAQYQGGTVNEETKEVTGGTWVETSGPSKEDYVYEAESIKSQLLAKVTVLISPLQDAVDIDEATEEETARLKVLKTYRVQLNRIDTSLAPDIVWPTKPEGIE